MLINHYKKFKKSEWIISILGNSFPIFNQFSRHDLSALKSFRHFFYWNLLTKQSFWFKILRAFGVSKVIFFRIVTIHKLQFSKIGNTLSFYQRIWKLWEWEVCLKDLRWEQVMMPKTVENGEKKSPYIYIFHLYFCPFLMIY